MSMQAGIWNFDGKPVEPRLLASFSEALKQQGTDDEFSFVHQNIAILYRPFHTTAESRREKQPHISRRGFVLTWDGRLDNREELISGMSSNLDHTATDIDIVAAAFDRWGTDCFQRFVGDWALSIWKPEERELIFAVDHMAIRHIFYYSRQDRIWWSTDLTPLVLFSDVKFHIDDEYIAGYFAHDPDGHLTPYCEIGQVPAGRFFRVLDGGRISSDRYWTFRPKSRIRYNTDREYEEHFRDVFRQSVRRRLRSDSPVLAELSGGLDSSAIVCVADDIRAKAASHMPPLDTLSYYDNTEPSGDDWIYFSKIEEKRGITGFHIDISSEDESASFDYPEFSPLPGYVAVGHKFEMQRSLFVRGGNYRVVLSGIGGDELMGGNPNPRAHLADLIMQFRFMALSKQLAAWSLVKRRPWTHLLAQALLELLPASLGQHLTKQGRIEPWISKAFATRTHLATRQLDVNEHFGFWLPTRRSQAAAVVLLASKMAKCIAPKPCAEEARYPYLDQTLVEFTLSIPASQLLRPGERRSLMRRSLAAIVPDEILSRRTKQFGARTPLLRLARHESHLRAVFDSSVSASFGYIDPERFVKTIREATHGQPVHISRLLRTVSLEFWLRVLAATNMIDVPTLPALSPTRLSSRERFERL